MKLILKGGKMGLGKRDEQHLNLVIILWHAMGAPICSLHFCLYETPLGSNNSIENTCSRYDIFIIPLHVFHIHKFEPQAKFNFDVSNHVLPIHFNSMNDLIMQNFQLLIFGILWYKSRIGVSKVKWTKRSGLLKILKYVLTQSHESR
jgi:hypothetical protein